MRALILTGLSFIDANVFDREVNDLRSKGYELYRSCVKYNEELFKNHTDVLVDKAVNTSYINPDDYDEVVIFREYGFEDVNSSVDNVVARSKKKTHIRVIESWDKNDPRLFNNKVIFPGSNVDEVLRYWSDAYPVGGTFIEKSMCSVPSAKPYITKVIGSLEVDLNGDIPSMRIEMGKHSAKLFYVFRFLFPEIFSRTVWYGFMCHRGMVYSLFGSMPTDPYKRNRVEVTRVAFYPGTKPTTSDIFAATLRTMHPYKPNLAEKYRSYDIQKYDSLGSYIGDPDNAYLLSQDSFVGVNIQSGGLFLMTLGEDGKIKTESL